MLSIIILPTDAAPQFLLKLTPTLIYIQFPFTSRISLTYLHDKKDHRPHNHTPFSSPVKTSLTRLPIKTDNFKLRFYFHRSVWFCPTDVNVEIHDVREQGVSFKVTAVLPTPLNGK